MTDMPAIRPNDPEQAQWVMDWLQQTKGRFAIRWQQDSGLGQFFEAIFGSPDEVSAPADGVWVARYSDISGVVPFATELDAFRHANHTSMEVVHVPWGQDIREAK